jgi:hypothetical protein
MTKDVNATAAIKSNNRFIFGLPDKTDKPYRHPERLVGHSPDVCFAKRGQQ